MADRNRIVKVTTGFAALALIAACGGKQEDVALSATPATVDCVAVEEGSYLFQDGKFRRVSAAATAPAASSPSVSPVPASTAPAQTLAASWPQEVEASFQPMGYEWMGLDVRGSTAILTGVAADKAEKTAAFEAGQAAILARAEGAGLNIINGISVKGGETGVGTALAALDDNPSLEACQNAFVQTMDGRNVQFRIGSATILPVSAQLLDAVSGVASQCNAYNIEIGGHTDSIGGALSNLQLSQQRANSVRAYLDSRGVDLSAIVAKGYGETRPIDTSGTRAGNALNRRTEFTVSER